MGLDKNLELKIPGLGAEGSGLKISGLGAEENGFNPLSPEPTVFSSLCFRFQQSFYFFNRTGRRSALSFIGYPGTGSNAVTRFGIEE